MKKILILFLLISNYAIAQCTLSGNTITQTGTTTVTECLDEVGISKQNIGSQNWYFIGDLKLSITGELNHDPEINAMIFGNNAPKATIDVNGGTYNINGEITENGFTRYSDKLAVYVGNSNGSNVFNSKEGSLDVRNGGQFNWSGGVINSIKGIGTEAGSGGSIKIRSGILNFTRFSGTSPQFRHLNGTYDIVGFKVLGGSATWGNLPVTNFLGYEPIHMEEPLVGGGSPNSQFFEVRNYAGQGNTQDVTFLNNTVRTTRMINPVNGSNIFGQGHLASTGTNRDGNLEIVSEFQYSLTDANGNPADKVKLFLEDVDSGNRLSRINDYVTDRDLLTLSDANGIITGSKLIATQISNNDPTRPIERRTKSQDITDVDDFKFMGYLYNIASFEQSHTGSGVKNYSSSLITDNLISELDQDVAATYTVDLNQFTAYDYYKGLLLSSFQGESETIITRDDTGINARNYDVVVNSTCTDAASFDGSTLTICGTFTGNITTTGTVTDADGVVNGLIKDANGVTFQVSDINNVPMNLLVWNNDTSSVLGFFEDVTSQSVSLPLGVNYSLATWKLGHLTRLTTGSSSDITGNIVLEHLPDVDVDTSLDVSVFIDNITIDISTAPGEYRIIFNAPMVINPQQSNVVLNYLAGYMESLILTAAAGATGTTATNADNIEINSPQFFFHRGASLGINDRVNLQQYFNLSNARLIQPDYVINPQDANGLFVLFTELPYAVDYSAFRNEILPDLKIINQGIKKTSTALGSDQHIQKIEN